MSGGHLAADDGSSKTEKKGSITMRTHVVALCSVVGFLGLVVVILGVAGEAATKLALDDIASELALKCVYRTTPALGCGIAAALLALAVECVVTAASLICWGCLQAWEPPKDTRRILSFVLLAVSWTVVLIVVALFIAGAASNTDHERQFSADLDCDHDPGSPLFAAATVVSIVATAMQIASYILLQVTPNKPLATQQPELAMAALPPVHPPEHLHQQDAAEVAAGGPLPPSAPPLSGDIQPTSQV